MDDRESNRRRERAAECRCGASGSEPESADSSSALACEKWDMRLRVRLWLAEPCDSLAATAAIESIGPELELSSDRAPRDAEPACSMASLTACSVSPIVVTADTGSVESTVHASAGNQGKPL